MEAKEKEMPLYAREELERRIFVADKEQWIEAASKDYRSGEEARVQTVEKGIILPLKRIDGTESYAGGVFDEGFNFIAESSGLWIAKADAQLQKACCEEAFKELDRGGAYIDESVVFGGLLSNHFGHALLECLSRLWLVLEGGGAERIAFLLYHIGGEADVNAFKNLYGDFFSLLGIDPKRIIYIQRPCRFARVVVPDSTIQAWGKDACVKDKYVSIYEKMASRVEARSFKKIYLTRTQLAKHDCLNEEYFEEFYRKRGYTVIAPERLALKEQVACMKGADEVACTMGTLSHLALFCKPGTRLTLLLRANALPTAQMIVNQAKKLDFYAVDVSFNFLPVSHSHSYSFLLGPSKYWKEYLDAAGEKCEKGELSWDISKFAYEYLLKWTKNASLYSGWTSGLASFDNFDVLNSLSSVLLEKPLKRENYIGSFKEKERDLLSQVERLKADIADPDIKRLEAEISQLQAENKWLKKDIERIKDSIWWKAAGLMRKIWGLLSERTKAKVRVIVERRVRK